MNTEQHDSKHPPSYRGRRLLKRFAEEFEPYGILIAVFGLAVALFTLWMEIDLRNRTLISMQEEREIREASLLSMLLERLDVARREKANYSGHVEILERIARIKMDLRNLDASLADFSVEGGIFLNDANLSSVNFAGSDLSEAKLANAILNNADLRGADLYGADLVNADLTRSDFKKANLRRANLTGATLEGTILRDTNVSDVNFRNAKGLRQEQLDTACADPEEPPLNLPMDSRNGKQLIWNKKECEECRPN